MILNKCTCAHRSSWRRSPGTEMMIHKIIAHYVISIFTTEIEVFKLRISEADSWQSARFDVKCGYVNKIFKYIYIIHAYNHLRIIISLSLFRTRMRNLSEFISGWMQREILLTTEAIVYLHSMFNEGRQTDEKQRIETQMHWSSSASVYENI